MTRCTIVIIMSVIYAMIGRQHRVDADWLSDFKSTVIKIEEKVQGTNTFENTKIAVNTVGKTAGHVFDTAKTAVRTVGEYIGNGFPSEQVDCRMRRVRKWIFSGRSSAQVHAKCYYKIQRYGEPVKRRLKDRGR